MSIHDHYMVSVIILKQHLSGSGFIIVTSIVRNVPLFENKRVKVTMDAMHLGKLHCIHMEEH